MRVLRVCYTNPLARRFNLPVATHIQSTDGDPAMSIRRGSLTGLQTQKRYASSSQRQPARTSYVITIFAARSFRSRHSELRRAPCAGAGVVLCERSLTSSHTRGFP